MFRRFRIIAFVMLLLVMARAMLPVGFMPEFSDGKVVITICHGADIQTVFVDNEKTPHKKIMPTCPFTPLASVAADIVSPLWNGYLLTAYMILLYGLIAQSEKVRIYYRPAQPRAPPFILH